MVYGVLADISIPRLFLAGVVPGLLQGAILMGYIVWVSRREGYSSGEDLPLREKLRRTLLAVPALLIPVIVLGGLYGGFVTLTESAALSAVVAILASIFIYRGIKLADLMSVMATAVRSAAVIMIIITTALAFGHWITETGAASRA